MDILLTLFLFVLWFLPTSAFTQVYCCENQAGGILYQEFPCGENLTIVKTLTLNIRAKETDAQKARRKKQELQNLRKANSIYQKFHKDKKRQFEKSQKLKVKQQNAKQRRQRRCEQIRGRIGLLERRLKEGYTERQGRSINRKLAEYKIMVKNYCYEC